jgi:hypothetical protein
MRLETVAVNVHVGVSVRFVFEIDDAGGCVLAVDWVGFVVAGDVVDRDGVGAFAFLGTGRSKNGRVLGLELRTMRESYKAFTLPGIMRAVARLASSRTMEHGDCRGCKSVAGVLMRM